MINEDFELCVTTEILLEYEEIIINHLGHITSEFVMQILENTSNIHCITRYFKWNLIKSDHDDNKFVDCAIACDAKFLITNDIHFNILRQMDFPIIEILKADDLLELLK